MSLSGNKIIDITTAQLLLEIAQSLATLQSDPDALDKAAKAAYALPDAEQAKAIEARAQIAKYQDFINQNDRQKQDIQTSLAEIAKKEANLEAQERKIANQKIDFNSTVAAFESTKQDILALDQSNKAKEKSYDQRKADLDRREDSLSERQAKIEQSEADMASRLEQMRLLAGGK